MFYVKMVDSFLSGWGQAEGKKAHLVIECETLAEAKIVEENAKLRSDMKNISIVTTKPNYNKNNVVAFHNKESYPKWFVEKFFE